MLAPSIPAPRYAPCNEPGVRTSGSGRVGQPLTNFKARPQRTEERLQRCLEPCRIARGAHLLHTVNGEAIPIEARGRIAWIEIAHHAVKAGESGDVLDFPAAAAVRMPPLRGAVAVNTMATSAVACPASPAFCASSRDETSALPWP